MRCPECGGDLRVQHTFQVRDDAMVRDHRCLTCRGVFSSVTFMPTNQRTSWQLRKDVRAGSVVLKEDVGGQ